MTYHKINTEQGYVIVDKEAKIKIEDWYIIGKSFYKATEKIVRTMLLNDLKATNSYFKIIASSFQIEGVYGIIDEAVGILKYRRKMCLRL